MAPKRARIPLWHDGDVTELVKGLGFLHYCCDCGAAHELVFEGVRGQRAKVRLFMRPRLTAAHRKRSRLKMVPRLPNPRKKSKPPQ